ncbi:ATP-binding protein [Geotalea sp. SG265]|uniref:sensor histidine kinase n=1 Tax=Geotalea sp. SG265 TaxID=2922867 RepID=UPI001FAEA50C|nr:ATP-binding protein [Geotalea sp. SG265]
MKKDDFHIPPGNDDQVAMLRQEIKTLSEQVKRLVKAESRLYRYQEELDAQLKEYKDLYELNKALNETVELSEMFRHTVDYFTCNLDYERAIALRFSGDSDDYRVAALAGYYDDKEKSCVAALTIGRDGPLPASFARGEEFLVCTAGSEDAELSAFGALAYLDEFFIFPLGSNFPPQALLAVGNSTEHTQFYRKVDAGHETLVSIGNAIGLVSSALEKTILYHALEESEYRLKNVVENLGEGLILIDPPSEGLQWNHAALQMYGYESQVDDVASCQNLGQVYELLQLDGKPVPVEQLPIKRILRGEEFREYQLVVKRRKKPWQRTFSFSGVLIRDGRGKPFVGLLTLRDISSQRQSENERERLIAELQRSNAELQQFAYVSSHDLQEPIRMVTSYAQLLQRRYQGKLDEKADTYISYMVEAAHRMSSLIDDLLALSRVGRSERPPAPVAMESVMQQALDNMRLSLEEAGAEVTYEALPTVPGDEIQLLQLLQNLIGNAVKYRKKDVPPRVHISAVRKGKQWIFGVHDNGIGIEPQYHERIFVIFQRLHHREDYPGTGIGLSICQKIVENHGGRIWVESTLGEGSTFFFTLPAKEGEGR